MGPAPHSFGATVCAVRRDLSYREATLCALISWAVRLIERPNQVWVPTSHIYGDRARAGARDIPLSLARSGDRAAEPGLVPDITIYGDRGARRGARYSLISCAVWRSSGRTRSGCRHHIYMAIGRGFLYPVAVMDWASRRWTYRSGSRLLSKRSRASADRRSSTLTRAAVHQRRRRRHAGGSGYSHLDGRSRPLDGR